MTDLSKVQVHAVLTGNFQIECTGADGETFVINPMEYGGDIEIHCTLEDLIPKLTTVIERRTRGDLVWKNLGLLAQALPSGYPDLIGWDIEERECRTTFGTVTQRWDAETKTLYREE